MGLLGSQPIIAAPIVAISSSSSDIVEAATKPEECVKRPVPGENRIIFVESTSIPLYWATGEPGREKNEIILRAAEGRV